MFNLGTMTDKASMKKYTNKMGIKISSKMYTYSSNKKMIMAVLSKNAKDIESFTVVFHINSPPDYYTTYKKRFTICSKNTTIFV